MHPVADQCTRPLWASCGNLGCSRVSFSEATSVLFHLVWNEWCRTQHLKFNGGSNFHSSGSRSSLSFTPYKVFLYSPLAIIMAWSLSPRWLQIKKDTTFTVIQIGRLLKCPSSKPSIRTFKKNQSKCPKIFYCLRTFVLSKIWPAESLPLSCYRSRIITSLWG